MVLRRAWIAVAAVLVLGAAPPNPLVRARQLYDEQKCRLCHSVGGVGNPKGAPIDEAGSKNTPEVTKMWLTQPKEMMEKTGSTRKPPMKSFAALPAEDIDAPVAYVSTLKKKE